MSQPDLEEAQLLLRKAQEDADAVKKLTPDSDIADSIVGFHALCRHQHNACYANSRIMLMLVVGVAVRVVVVAWGSA